LASIDRPTRSGCCASWRVERDAHRHPLHHLDPVAGGVLRRQQRERRAGADAEAGDRALVFDLLAVDVGGQLHRLADADLAQLHFLEVGVDPDLVQRDDGHQRRAGGDALAELHGALGDVAVHRRRQRGALLRQPGFAHLGGGGLHLRVLLDVGAFGHGLVAGQLLARADHAGLRGGQRAARAFSCDCA
jgi:hypothetical protein